MKIILNTGSLLFSIIFIIIFIFSLFLKLPNSNITVLITGASLLFSIVFLKIFLMVNKNVNLIHNINIAFNITMIISILIFGIVEYKILSYSHLKDEEKPNYIIVLGAAINGNYPSDALRRRLEASLLLIEKYEDAKIILSGSKGPGENITEAEAMKRYLEERGVDSNRIIKEEKSTNTYLNLKNSKEIIDGLENGKIPTITIVTSNFHMYRTKVICNKLNLKAYGYTSEVLKSIEKILYFREFFAVIKTYIFY